MVDVELTLSPTPVLRQPKNVVAYANAAATEGDEVKVKFERVYVFV